jgi:hypothetical protein
MRKILTLSLIATMLFSCQENKTKQVHNNKNIDKSVKAKNKKDFYGFWVGQFEVEKFNPAYEGDYPERSDKLNIAIKQIVKDSVFGESVVSGNKRFLKGTLLNVKGTMKFVLNEPGDNKYDGRFEFESNLNGKMLSGTWNAYSADAHRPKRKYKLLKQEFEYNPDLMLLNENDSEIDWYTVKEIPMQETIDGKIERWSSKVYRVSSAAVYKLNASNAALKEQDLKNLLKLDMEIIKNCIYARHGYAFKNKIYRQFFDQTSWYVPVSDNIDNDLTSIEKANIKILDRFIKYAEDNYQTFGR